ncbi:MAG: DUF1820 family protein [Gammaproteobacteria bacterium]|jgi:hypothetical protein
MREKPVYKIIFHNQDKIFEVYAKSVHQGAMFGFIEIEELLFGEKSSIVVDPSEESLKAEFNHVSRTYIPMHSIIRIDEVDKQGASKISKGNNQGNVTHFPVYTSGDKSKK